MVITSYLTKTCPSFFCCAFVLYMGLLFNIMLKICNFQYDLYIFSRIEFMLQKCVNYSNVNNIVLARNRVHTVG